MAAEKRRLVIEVDPDERGFHFQRAHGAVQAFGMAENEDYDLGQAGNGWKWRWVEDAEPQPHEHEWHLRREQDGPLSGPLCGCDVPCTMVVKAANATCIECLRIAAAEPQQDPAPVAAAQDAEEERLSRIIHLKKDGASSLVCGTAIEESSFNTYEQAVTCSKCLLIELNARTANLQKAAALHASSLAAVRALHRSGERVRKARKRSQCEAEKLDRALAREERASAEVKRVEAALAEACGGGKGVGE